MNDTPKALRYLDALADIERRVIDALPEIVDALIHRAKGGDLKAAAYLCDRIMGKVVTASSAPADDRALPYSHDAYVLDRATEQSGAELALAFLPQSGARKKA